jgi:hypothetical protein
MRIQISQQPNNLHHPLHPYHLLVYPICVHSPHQLILHTPTLTMFLLVVHAHSYQMPSVHRLLLLNDSLKSKIISIKQIIKTNLDEMSHQRFDSVARPNFVVAAAVVDHSQNGTINVQMGQMKCRTRILVIIC